MASKLKILVDYTCEVFCDFKLIGVATPDKLFCLELRKGKYIIELKVKDENAESYIFNKSFDYIMESNDEEDLLRINLLNHILIKPLVVRRLSNISSYREYSDNNNGERTYSRAFIKCEKDELSEIELSFFKGSRIIDLTFIARIEHDCSCWDYEDIDKQEIELNISLEIDNYKQTILYDGKWLSEIGLIIYANNNIYIYELDKKSDKGWKSFTTYPRFGDIYAPYKETVFFLKDGKFGLYDLTNKQILINPLYDEIYNQADCRGEIWNTLYYKRDKTFIIKNNNLTNKIDFNGNLIVPMEYNIIFSCYLGNVVKKDDKWGIYTKDGLKEWFDDIYIYDRYSKYDTHHDIDEYDMEILFCKKNDKFGFWNCVGELSDIIYDGFDTSRLDGHIGDDFIFTKSRGKTGLINNRGVVFIDCVYDKIYFEYFQEASIYIFDIFPSFVYYTMTNKKTESYLKWEKEMIEKGKLKTDYSFDEAKKMIYIPQFIVRNGDLYGVVQLDKKEILPVLYTKQETEYYVQQKAIEWSNKLM